MRTLWIIDAGYATSLQRKMDIEIDFFKLKKYLKRELVKEFGKNSEISDAYYMTATDPTDLKAKKFLSWLQLAEPHGPKISVKNYTFKGMTCRCPNCNNEFERKVQKGVDVGIATLMLKLLNNYDCLILFGGDGDFSDAISYLKDQNKSLWLLGKFGSIAGELQSTVGRVIWLDDIVKKIAKEKEPTEKVKSVADDVSEEVIVLENELRCKQENFQEVEMMNKVDIPEAEFTETEEPTEEPQEESEEKKNKPPRKYNRFQQNKRYYPKKKKFYNEEKQPESYESALGANALKKQSRQYSEHYRENNYRPQGKKYYRKHHDGQPAGYEGGDYSGRYTNSRWGNGNNRPKN